MELCKYSPQAVVLPLRRYSQMKSCKFVSTEINSSQMKIKNKAEPPRVFVVIEPEHIFVCFKHFKNRSTNQGELNTSFIIINIINNMNVYISQLEKCDPPQQNESQVAKMRFGVINTNRKIRMSAFIKSKQLFNPSTVFILLEICAPASPPPPPPPPPPPNSSSMFVYFTGAFSDSVKHSFDAHHHHTSSRNHFFFQSDSFQTVKACLFTFTVLLESFSSIILINSSTEKDKPSLS
ncbi:hypothetical protein GQR58_010993 [Nymphon striatum]|nr:hypothetical protein GQR58_010993 [Nymphon striatum]